MKQILFSVKKVDQGHNSFYTADEKIWKWPIIDQVLNVEVTQEEKDLAENGERRHRDTMSSLQKLLSCYQTIEFLL